MCGRTALTLDKEAVIKKCVFKTKKKPKKEGGGDTSHGAKEGGVDSDQESSLVPVWRDSPSGATWSPSPNIAPTLHTPVISMDKVGTSLSFLSSNNHSISRVGRCACSRCCGGWSRPGTAAPPPPPTASPPTTAGWRAWPPASSTVPASHPGADISLDYLQYLLPHLYCNTGGVWWCARDSTSGANRRLGPSSPTSSPGPWPRVSRKRG